MGHAFVEKEFVSGEVVELFEPVIQKQMKFSAIVTLGSGIFKVVDKIQILTFVMQIDITAILKSRGVKPKAVVGHFLRGIAASVVAGALDLIEDTLVCCVRAGLYKNVAGAETMFLVNLPFFQPIES